MRSRYDPIPKSRFPPLSVGGCVSRAMATMRLALGYTPALPIEWPDVPETGIHPVEFVHYMDALFPGRQVVMAFTDWDGTPYKGSVPPNVVYFSDSVINQESDWIFGDVVCTQNTHLFAFGYSSPGKEAAHLVIGIPALLSGYPVAMIMAVSLEPIYGTTMFTGV